MNFELPNESQLPNGFIYPESFLKVVRLNLLNLDPWFIMDKGQVVTRKGGLVKRFPDRELIPFARRFDNDDIACFELGKGNEVQIIHDFSSPGYEQRKQFDNFWDWFKEAINEMIWLDY